MLKSKSELEIVNLMNYELVKTANNQDFSNLEQAIDYLNSAIDTLEDAGFSAYADRLLTLIIKIAATNRRNVLMDIDPSPQKFIQNLQKINYPIDRYLEKINNPNTSEEEKKEILLKINQDVRNTNKSIIYIISNILNLGSKNPTEDDFKRVLGIYYMPLEAVQAGSFYTEIPGVKRMTQKEYMKYRSENPLYSMRTDIPAPPFKTTDLPMPKGIRPPFETPPGLFDEPMITSASRKYKPKNPTNVSKRHSEKFVKNLKETGTMFSKKDFNMADNLLNADIEFEDEDDPELEV
jgi:hypothetical protein